MPGPATPLPRLAFPSRVVEGRRSPVTLAALAVLCGFGIAASCVTMVRAADGFNFFDLFFMPRLDRFVDPVRLHPRYAGQQPVVRRPRVARRKEPRRREVRRPASGPKESRTAGTPAALPPPRQTARPTPVRPVVPVSYAGPGTMCVRTCDGYAFPLGTLHARSDLPAHANACQAACPGTDTKLYTLTSGASLDNPGSARAFSDGALYRTLKTAFLYRTRTVADCSCQGPGNVASHVPILLDPTLRSGDVVIDREGEPKAFAGPVAARHSPRSFDDIRKTRVLTRTAKAQIDRMVGPQARRVAAARSERVREASLGSTAAVLPGGSSMRETAAPAGSAASVRAYSLGLGDSAPRIITIR